MISDLILVFLVLLASCATGSRSSFKKAFDEEIVGTWANRDYDKGEKGFEEGPPYAKMIVKHDKTFEAYNNVSSKDFAIGEITITDRWTDSEGNIMYKTICDFVVWKTYELWKISNSGTNWELVWSTME